MTPCLRRFPWFVVCVLLASCGGGAAPSGETAQAPRSPILVETSAGASLPELHELAAAEDWAIVRTYEIPASPESDGTMLCVLEPGPEAAPSEDVIEIFRSHPDVEGAEADDDCDARRPLGGDQSSVPVFDDEVSLSVATDQEALRAIGARDPRAAMGGEGVLVAVLDGGFDLRHEALAGRWVPGGYDAVDRDHDCTDLGNGIDDDGDGSIDDCLGHGTAVAALVLSVAPRARVLPVRVLDDEGHGSTERVAVGILAAIDAGARVVNLSASTTKSSPLLEDVIGRARERGVLVVASVGAGGTRKLGCPASFPDVLAVGGSLDGFRYDEDANYGSEVDLSAPSRDVLAPFPGTTDGYGRWCGTSMSSALVSGGAAVAFSLDRAADAVLVRERLVAAATPYATVSWWRTDRVGSGVLNLLPLFP